MSFEEHCVREAFKSIDCWCDQLVTKNKCQRCEAMERLGL